MRAFSKLALPYKPQYRKRRSSRSRIFRPSCKVTGESTTDRVIRLNGMRYLQSGNLRVGGSLRLPPSLRKTIGQRRFSVKTRNNLEIGLSPKILRLRPCEFGRSEFSKRWIVFLPRWRALELALLLSRRLPSLFSARKSLVAQAHHGIHLSRSPPGHVPSEHSRY